MPIKNYTTEVNATRTIGEISDQLVSHGARRVQVDYDTQRQIEGIAFDFPVQGINIHFRLPTNAQGVHAVLQSQAGVDRRQKTLEHAHKVSLRILKDWIAAQMAIVEAGAAQLAEVFLPYAVQADGKTMFQAFEEHQQKLLQETNPGAKKK